MTETLVHDAVTQLLFDQVSEKIGTIAKANESLLADDSGTGVREIDKALKEGVENKKIQSLWNQAEKARTVYKETVEKARNLYRTEVLKEDEVTESDVDKDAVKQDRKMVMEAVSLLKTYASANGMKDIVKWADNLSIPQVGRQGSSNVGQKKPRAFVSVDGTVYNSFGEAAKSFGDKENPSTVTSANLVSAHEAAGSPETFTYEGHSIKVVLKPKAAKA